MVSDTWEIFKERFGPLLLIEGVGAGASLASVVVPFLGAMAWTLLRPASYAPWACASVLALSGVLWFASWAQVAMLEAVLSRGRRLGVAEAYRVTWGKIVGFSWVCILWFVVTVGGLFLLVLPGLYLAVALAFAPIIYAAEGAQGLDALVLSLERVRGRWLPVCGRLILVGTATSLPSAIPVVGPFTSVVTAPFALANVAVLYLALRELPPAAPRARPWKAKVLLCAAVLGFSLPVWNTWRLLPTMKAMIPAIRDAAADLARNPRDPATLEKLLSLLEGKLTPENVTVAFQLMQAAGGAHSPELPGLVARLQSPDPEERLAAALRLERINDPATGAPLILALVGRDDGVRPVARRALERMGYDVLSLPAVRAKADEMMQDLASPYAGSRRNAVLVLGDLGDPRALPSLKSLAAGASPESAPELFEAIAKIERASAAVEGR